MPSNFKNLVRARVEKTGESWSTAARHVRAQATAVPHAEPRVTAAPSRLDADRSPDEHVALLASDSLTLGQLLAAVHKLFAQNREGSTFTAQVESLQVPDARIRDGLVAEVPPPVAVRFKRAEVAWTFVGELVFIDGEVYDGFDKLDAAWLSTESGRERLHKTLRTEIERKYRALVPVLTDMRVEGGRTRATNILLDVRIMLVHPLYALLHSLQAPSTFSVITGRVPALGGSPSLEALEQSQRRFSTDPQWYAESGGVQRLVPKAEHEMLVASGAADDRQVQMIRSFDDESRRTFAAQCDNCPRWISCGEVEREDTCTCGQKYRVVFDLAPVKHWTMHRAALLHGLRQGDGDARPGRTATALESHQ